MMSRSWATRRGEELFAHETAALAEAEEGLVRLIGPE